MMDKALVINNLQIYKFSDQAMTYSFDSNFLSKFLSQKSNEIFNVDLLIEKEFKIQMIDVHFIRLYRDL